MKNSLVTNGPGKQRPNAASSLSALLAAMACRSREELIDHQALSVLPDTDALVLSRYALILALQGDIDWAAELLSVLVTVKPYLPSLLLTAGMVLLLAQKLHEADTHFLAYSALRPDSRAAIAGQLAVAALSGRHERVPGLLRSIGAIDG